MIARAAGKSAPTWARFPPAGSVRVLGGSSLARVSQLINHSAEYNDGQTLEEPFQELDVRPKEFQI